MSEIDGRRANRPTGDRAAGLTTAAEPMAAAGLADGVGPLGHRPGLDGLRALAVVADPARTELTDIEAERAVAVASAVAPAAKVLVVGSPLPGLGDALEARGCTVTALGPPGHPIAEPWATQVGSVDEVRPDPGSLGTFDAIVAPHLLDLAEDPATALRRIAGALRAAGRIVLVVSWPAPPGALHLHDLAQVERLCERSGLVVRAVAPEHRRRALADSEAVVAGAPITVVVAQRAPKTPPSPPLLERAAAQATVTVAVDRRLRYQQARIRALEDEVRALRAAVDGAPRLARVASAVKAWMRPRA